MSVISAADVEKARGVLSIGVKDILTPLALDRAKELGVRIERAASTAVKPSAAAPVAPKPLRLHDSVGPTHPPQPGALSGALYRRGAPVPARLRTTPDKAPADARPVVAIIGAGHVGAVTALRLAETSLFAEIALIDIVPGLAAGLALDLWHSAGLRGFTTRIQGSTELAALAGADYVVVTAGRPRQPGMSRTDLTQVNAEIIAGVAEGIRRHAPAAVVVVVTNPLEEMTHLMAKITGFAPSRVIGMAGVLDSTRFCSLVALTRIAQPQDIQAIALGSHGAEMVIPLSQATVNGEPLEAALPAEQLTAIVERARDSGAEVVQLLQKGSAYFSPAAAVAAMVVAMASDSNDVLAACVQSAGAYGIADTRIGLPVRLGRAGVKEIVKLALRDSELAALGEAARSIAARIGALG